MKKTGAQLLVYALEQIGITHTFGIPGVHNTEIYDELNKSTQIEPILVTHEGAGAFMADGVSRTSDSIGTMVIVPAAGMTHAMSGIGEAYLDGIPLLVISGGTRRDTGKQYQLHQLDQGKVLDGIVKKYFLVKDHASIIPVIYDAYKTAIMGEPGPVFVEVPVEIQLFRGSVSELPVFSYDPPEFSIDEKDIEEACQLLTAAKNPGIYTGWGAREASEELIELAELINAPVSTTLQGLSVFPANNTLHTGVGFGAASVPAAQQAFKECDCLLAIGARFSELGTGSYGVEVPENLIHIDINEKVFDQNYPTKVKICSDAKFALRAIINFLKEEGFQSSIDGQQVRQTIAKNKAAYYLEWRDKKQNEKVSPCFFFQSLRKALPDEAIVFTDDGKHTFLTAELFPVMYPKHFISPTDFNCMGYCVPATIGAKIANPGKQVVGIVGDGAFLMTGLELLTAASNNAGVIIFLFNDGELGQISQFQKIPLNRKTCTVLGKYKAEGIATATGAAYIPLNNDFETDMVIENALSKSKEGTPVIIDVNIDYSKKTFLTKGVVKTNLSRFPLSEKLRFVGRSIKRHIIG